MNNMNCEECYEQTTHSYFRDDETETVCEDCWIEYITEIKLDLC
jgi:hypothetical protein